MMVQSDGQMHQRCVLSVVALAMLAMLAFLAPATAITTNGTLINAIALRDVVHNRSVNWRKATETWTCPTDPQSSDQECDICSRDWSGNWEHVHCRGASGPYGEGSTGERDGLITTFHITDVNLDGPVPRQFCWISSVREFDLDGGQLTGPFPRWLLEPNPDPAAGGQQCLPNVQELDMSYNLITGTLPATISTKTTLQELKVEHNHMSGTIPDTIGQLRKLFRLRLQGNHFHGTLPASLSNLTASLSEFWIDNNDFEGNLYMLGQTKLSWALVHNNPKLCGMVPASVRWAHGYNPAGTRLGQPC